MVSKMSAVVVSVVVLAVLFSYGTEADISKCKFYQVDLRPCNNQTQCLDLCVHQKYQSGSCGFIGTQLDTVCYCYNCADETTALPLRGETSGAYMLKPPIERLVLLVRSSLFVSK